MKALATWLGVLAASLAGLANAQQPDVIAPGETIPVVVKLERNGFDGDVKFGTEFAGRNLPHGVYIDNIGLNGVLIPEGQTQRQLFINARSWVPETARPFHAVAPVAGVQVSPAIVLRVKK